MAKTENAKTEGFYIESLKIGKIQFVGRCGQVEEVFRICYLPITKTTPRHQQEDKNGIVYNQLCAYAIRL